MIRRHRTLIGLMAILALVAAACGDGDAETAPVTPTEAGAATDVAAFDLEGVVAGYLAGIPAGYLAVGDLTAFKDAVEGGGAAVIDVREADEYAAGHLPGAVSVPLRSVGASLNQIPTDRQVFVYCQSGYRAALATSALHILGYDNVLAFPPGYQGWTAAGEPVSTDPVQAGTYLVPDVEPALFAAVDGFLAGIPDGYLSAGDAAKVQAAIDAGASMLDVRTDDEWGEGHIPGATHVELRALGARLDEIPRDRTVITYCKSGHRAALATAALRVLGFDNVEAFPAGWTGWAEAGPPGDG